MLFLLFYDKMNIMKRIRSIIITIILLVSILNIKAYEIDDLSSKYVIVYNLDEDKIIYEKNANEQTSIASLTKIMTTIVAIENITDLKEKVTVTEEMLYGIPWDASVAGLNIGDTLTYEDLLYASMIPSGADATQVLAVSLTGSVENFVDKMNEKATELNLTQTHFINTTGLDAEGHYSTAKDVLELLKYSLQNKTFKKVYQTRKYITSNNIELTSKLDDYNKRLGYDLSFIKGNKTGFTEEAGVCLSTLSVINNTNIISITINAPYNLYSYTKHIEDTYHIYENISNDFTRYTLAEKDTTLMKIKTKYAKEEKVSITTNKELTKLLENPINEEDVKYKYKGIDIIKYDTPINTKVGKIEVYYKNKLVDTVPALTANTLHFSIFAFIKTNILFIFLGITLVITLIIVIKRKNKKARIK